MAGFIQTPASAAIATKAYDTALCILPPVEQSYHVQRLRELYDTAYETWPPHINLVYPFVAPEDLPEAQKRIKDEIDRDPDLSDSRRIMLDSAGLFKQRSHSTILLHESPSTSDGSLDLLRSTVLRALGQSPTRCNFHMTIGQSENNSISSQEFMLSKARLLPHLDFQIGSLAILIRERTPGPDVTSKMKLWGLIDIAPGTEAVLQPAITDYWPGTPNHDSTLNELGVDEPEDLEESQSRVSHLQVQPGKTYTFDTSQDRWKVMTETTRNQTPNNLSVSSYNVLIDSEFPPAQDRNRLLVDTILSSAATADILVLQEVSDDFLSHLLSISDVRSEYPFTSHPPPSQSDVGPLPSLRNIVVLSKWPFDWKLIPFPRKHKSAIIAVFENLLPGPPLVVGGVHLTCGLTDGSVAAKKVQVQVLTKYLAKAYGDSPWIVAGDFNLVTSTYTIDTALKDKSITNETSATLSAIEDTLSGNGLIDTWSTSASDSDIISNDDLFPGEQGATFDPRSNILAASTSGTSSNRPQRYDRILVRPQETLCTSGFNHFGLPDEVSGRQLVASDHSGVRASMRLLEAVTTISPEHRELLAALPVYHQQVPPSMTDDDAVSMLNAHHMFPTDEEVQQRETAFVLLKQIVLGVTEDGDSPSPEIPLVMVPVGSYALGAWTSDSDIDCLCIGTISSKTFFKLARQRLQRAENQGVRIMRKVEAGTGTMLELSVNGIAMDLQYCPAARVVERYASSALDVSPHANSYLGGPNSRTSQPQTPSSTSRSSHCANSSHTATSSTYSARSLRSQPSDSPTAPSSYGPARVVSTRPSLASWAACTSRSCCRGCTSGSRTTTLPTTSA
jgi:endonuclease/exonuclease/phosphatase family metal-dependent hydrolase